MDLALTAPTFKGRILGKSKEIEVPMNVVFFASGNNLTFKGDMTRRAVPIDLDPAMEKPEERTDFAHSPLLPWVQAHRPQFVVDALTILRAYFEAGKPSQGVTPYGSFEEWSALVREALIWVDEPDPNMGRETINTDSDPRLSALGQLLATWATCYGTGTVKALKQVQADIGLHCSPDTSAPPTKWDDLQEALGNLDSRYDGKRLDMKRVGYALRGLAGRIVDGKRLIQDGVDHNKVTLWRLQEVR